MTQPSPDNNQPLTDPMIRAKAEQLHFDDVPLPPVITIPRLQELRELKNMSVDEAATSLRLSQAQINALEAHNWGALPGTAYIKGFLRNYARLLNVDPEGYIAQYDSSLQPLDASSIASPHSIASHNNVASIAPKKPNPLPSLHESAHQQKMQHSLYGLVALLIASTILFLLYWERNMWMPRMTVILDPISGWFNSSLKNQPASKPSPSPASPSEPVASSANSIASPTGVNTQAKLPIEATLTEATSNLSASTPPAITKPAIDALRVISFQIEKPVWLEVRDSGNNIIYYGTKAANIKETIKGTAPLSVVIGAADALKMEVDGKSFDLKSTAIGNVARFKLQ